MCLIAKKKCRIHRMRHLYTCFRKKKKSSTNADYISLMVFSAIALSSSEMPYLAKS